MDEQFVQLFLLLNMLKRRECSTAGGGLKQALPESAAESSIALPVQSRAKADKA
jgi:hypothetical protein